MIISGTCDLPAKALFMNIQQYNGRNDCPNCEIETKRIDNHQMYPFLDRGSIRTTEKTKTYAKQAIETNTPFLGVKGFSPLSLNLPILKDIMDKRYFEHHKLLVHALTLLNFLSTDDEMIELSRRLLFEYVKRYEVLYGKKYMVYPVAKAIRRQESTSGATLTCGQRDTGQLGLGEEVLEKTRFTEVSKLKDVISVAGGGMHNIILTNDSCVATFGCNDEGELGRDITECGEATPGFVELPARAIQVTAGDSHSAALLEDGRVDCWGAFRDSHGTLGLITRKKEDTPIEILPNIKFLKIASGSDHIVLLNNTGTVFTLGCAEQGQLGRVSVRKLDRHSRRGKYQLLTPEQVYFNIKKNIIIRNIWAGSFYTFTKAGNSDLYVSELNNYNQIGLKGCDKTLHPKVSHTFSRHRWMQISSGQHHTVAVNDQGQVYTIGRKEYGRLGLGSLCEDAQELIPVPKLENLKCIDVAAGTAQSFAVTNTGTLYAWGMGSEGQLGTGKEEDIYEPELINSKHVKDAIVLQVSGGGQHTIILVKKPHSSLI
ncbi:regulator of chromosome condensation-like [Copidosoma floridanum]|uniref:regulator of chromosome condensation-like n=1 Tax=Copidosoma floridanum TaxID=29053 RepID=UPI000C6FBA4B|nr:regulator of chromosome condensation-like [Copidosoma floridanum]